MARNARSLISPYEAEARAQGELHRLGVKLGLPTKWRMKSPNADGRSMGYARSWHNKPKRRRGQHRSHTNSRTGGGSGKRQGN